MNNINLNKISISNARRFAKDVEIDFGKGATILLAPNGTGKTTIFEAIELALTGSLESKLGNPPNALIKDGKKELDIRLDFDNNLFCEVSFRHGSSPTLKGNHDILFGDKSDSVPYLLGLTHILDQRGKGWFVTSDQKGAGDKLDKLSIGQGLNTVNSKKTSITRVINQEVTLLKGTLEQKNNNLKEFEKIKMERDSSSSDYKLLPLESIHKTINSGYRLLNDSDIAIELNQEALSIFLEQTNILLDTEIDKVSKLKVKYSSIGYKLNYYKASSVLIKNKNTDIKNIKTQISTINEEQTAHQKKLVEDDKSKVILIEEYENIKLIENIINLLLIEKNKYAQAIQTYRILEKNVVEKEKNIYPIQKELDSFLKLKKEHEVLDSEISQSTKLESDIIKLYPLQDQWVSLAREISIREQQIIPNEEKYKVELSKKAEDLKKVIHQLSLKIEQTAEILNKYVKGANVIQRSVTDISRYLPLNQDNCPVCNTVFTHDQLQEQIKIALELMNPVSHNMTQEIKGLELEQNKLIDKLNNTKLSIKETDNKLLKEKSVIANDKTRVLSIMKSFPGCSNPEMGLKYITTTLEKNVSNQKQLIEKKKLLTEKPLDNTITDVRLKYERSRIDFEESKLEEKAKKQELKILSKKIEEFEKKTKGNKLDRIINNKSKLEEKIVTSDKLIYENQQNKKLLDTKLKTLQTELIEIKDQLLRLNSKQISIETEWSESGLQDKPKQVTLILAMGKIESLQKKYEKSIVQLNQTRKELIIWDKASRFIMLDKKVKSLCEDRTESEYLSFLMEEVKNLEVNLSRMQEKQATIKTLFSNVASELNNVSQYIDSINEPWGELIKRTIVNSRFSTGELLKSSTFRNKPTAEIGAMLNGHNIPVNLIASEAQLTDLQLTFMLAMAKQHQWTPWKALLLDDPTQHHDLVHASSVFDLLRDYISDFDFQLLLSTHDSQQANFFRRKLENDGIENKVYKLKVGKDGVFADLI
mgnify:CR=1 FL=1